MTFAWRNITSYSFLGGSGFGCRGSGVGCREVGRGSFGIFKLFQIPNPKSQIPNPEPQIPNPKKLAT
jgi:hypothetical protein